MKAGNKASTRSSDRVSRRYTMMLARTPLQDGYTELVRRENTGGSTNKSARDEEDATRAVTRLPVPAEAPSAQPKSFWSNEGQAWAYVACKGVNTLLVFVPLGLLATFRSWSSGLVFFFNFLAIIPLAHVLGVAAEATANHTGQIVGGLLTATFGNAVEMIVCMQAVRAGLIRVVQGNLLGSILSNLLLVLGMAIFGAGVMRHQQCFNAQGAAASMTCQVVASISICLPTMFGGVEGTSAEEVLKISRICSVVLAGVYFLFLLFQLKTHADLFQDEHAEEEHPDNEPHLSWASSTFLLAASTTVVALCSEGLVDSIEDVSDRFGIPKAFIGVILLPIVGNAAEHATAVTCAMKGMMDLSLGVAVGSSTQIALFVVPCSVLFGWAFNKPMSLDFRNFDTACQMLSVFLVSQVLQHGNTNWLHGAMLMATYVLIAIMSWFIPE